MTLHFPNVVSFKSNVINDIKKNETKEEGDFLNLKIHGQIEEELMILT